MYNFERDDDIYQIDMGDKLESLLFLIVNSNLKRTEGKSGYKI